MKERSVHGHYSNTLKTEAERIKRLYKEKINVDITWVEATSIAAMRSQSTFMTDKELKDLIIRLRGL